MNETEYFIYQIESLKAEVKAFEEHKKHSQNMLTKLREKCKHPSEYCEKRVSSIGTKYTRCTICSRLIQNK
jgi:hypothetical protein